MTHEQDGEADHLAGEPRGVHRRDLLLGSTSVVGAAVAAGVSGPARAQAGGEIANVFPSRYMNAAGTPLVTIARGALVSEDTAAYWNLPEDSPQRASYDADIVVKAADGVWTFGSESIVNCHAVEGPEGLVVYDTGDNLADGAHFYGLLRSATDAPIRAIVYSHEHYVAGAKAFIDAEGPAASQPFIQRSAACRSRARSSSSTSICRRRGPTAGSRTRSSLARAASCRSTPPWRMVRR
jgi:hypothetical protein